MWHNNKHIISRSIWCGIRCCCSSRWWCSALYFHFISFHADEEKSIWERSLSSGRFRINKRIRYRLYQVISRNAVEQIERTHGFDRKRMKPKQKNWEKEMFIMWSNRVIGLMDHPAPKQKHTNTSNHNYGWKQLLFAWPLCAPARLSTRSFVGSIARTHARHARPTVHRTTQLHSDVHTNINIIIKLDAHHKFQSVCKERLGHLYIRITTWYRSLDLVKKVKVHIHAVCYTIDFWDGHTICKAVKFAAHLQSLLLWDRCACTLIILPFDRSRFTFCTPSMQSKTLSEGTKLLRHRTLNFAIKSIVCVYWVCVCAWCTICPQTNDHFP